MAGKPGRPGAAKGGKGPTKGSGGKNKRSLEGRGPTPKAEDRAWHPAGKRKAAAERYAAAGGKPKPKQANMNRSLSKCRASPPSLLTKYCSMMCSVIIFPCLKIFPATSMATTGSHTFNCLKK